MASFQIQSSEVLARLKPFGISFEKSLSDLIKGIRSHSKDSPESLLVFLDNAIQECKDELTTTDLEIKATAVLKLAYLEMYGFDMSWCNFQILEVMSSSKFQQKRIGYLAAMQSFKSEQDLLILATNQFKKDLNSHNHIEIGLALSGIATIVSANLAKDIIDDVVMKLTHLKPYIRKKAVLALYKVFLQYPESLRSALPRVIEKLDDTDVSVVSATITVICEISKKNPHIFMSSLPKIFSILEDTMNNWLIIRILKLFQSLLKVEPRMKKKILPSILTLMAKTDATSLIYECINCIVNGGMLSADSTRDREIAKLCIDQLMKFFETRDLNLIFVGLIALINILKLFPEFMHKIKGVSRVIMECLTHHDLIIKRKALEICQYLVTEDNIADIVKVLLTQLLPDEHNYHIPEDIKLEITDKILQIASQDNYSNIPNFKWYVTALKELISLTLLLLPSDTSVALSKQAADHIAQKLGKEFKSLATRVPSIRAFILSKVIAQYVDDARPLQVCPLLMKDLYWILGEYVDEFGFEDDDTENRVGSLGNKIRVYNAFVNNYIDVELKTKQFPVSSAIINLGDLSVLVIYIQTLIKLYNGIFTDYRELYLNYGKLPHDKYTQVAFYLWKAIIFLENWQNHSDYEVQERALSWLEFLRLCLDALTKEDLSDLDKVKADELAYYKRIVDQSRRNEESDEDRKSDESSDEDGEENESNMLELESESSSEEEEEEEHVENEPESSHQDKDLPPLLTEILPSFFKSYQLNPISATAQRRIPVPDDLDIQTQINSPPDFCLVPSEPESEEETIESADEVHMSSESEPVDEEIARQRKERLKDDPYYITPKTKKRSGKHRQKIFGVDEETSFEALSERASIASPPTEHKEKKKSRKMKKEKVVVLDEETLGAPNDEDVVVPKKNKKKKDNLFTNNLNLDDFDLESNVPPEGADKKDFEYDIDLDALRAQLAAKEAKKAEREERKKKKKSTKSKAEKATKKLPVEAPTSRLADEDVTQKEPSNEALVEAAESVELKTDDKVVTVPTKKAKKKKKATILD